MIKKPNAGIAKNRKPKGVASKIKAITGGKRVMRGANVVTGKSGEKHIATNIPKVGEKKPNIPQV